MYTHEVASCDSVTALMHFRETKLASGLVTLKELGHTVPILEPNQTITKSAGIAVPCEHEVAMFGHQRPDYVPGIAADQIQCEGLDDFVREGVRKWGSLIASLGNVLSIDVHLEEIAQPQPSNVSDLVVFGQPAPDPEYEFQGYVANTDEIEAMQKIANSVSLLAADAGLDARSTLYL